MTRKLEQSLFEIESGIANLAVTYMTTLVDAGHSSAEAIAKTVTMIKKILNTINIKENEK